MKHRFLFIMALLLTAAASAWADEPTVYTSAVSVYSLEGGGEILADGFSLTGNDDDQICFIANRYNNGGSTGTDDAFFSLSNITYGENGAISVTTGSEPVTITPVDENGQVGNAWVVTGIGGSLDGDGTIIQIAGITYGSTPTDSPIDLTYDATAGGWTYTQPACDVELEMEYYDPATLASAPTAATSLEYSSEAQNLITAGTATGGTLYYGLGTADAAPTDASAWSETVPTGTTVGMYYVWYKVVGDATHGDIAPAGPLSVTIAKATPTISEAPTARAITYGQTLAESTLDRGSATYNSQPVTGSFAWANPTTAPSVSDSENTEYSVTFTPTDGTNYNSATTTVTLTVNPGSMTEGITVTPYNAAYDGSAHGITVALSGVAEGATVKYRTAETGEYDLTDCPTYTGVGSYTTYYQVTKTNYTTVESSATVTITKATATISYATTEVSKAFGGDAFTNTLTETPATGTGLGTVAYAVTAETPGEGCTSEHVATINASTGVVTIIGAGSATITATVTDGDNYTYSGMVGYNSDSKTASVNYTLTVNPVSLEGATVTLSQDSYDYDGTAKEPTVSSVILNSNTLAGTDYSVSYSKNTNAALSTAGENAPTVTVTGMGNYSGTASQTFTINKATATISYATTTVSKAFGDAAFTNALNNTPAAGTDGTGLGTVTYAVTAEAKDEGCTSEQVATIDASTGEVTITGTGSATITATATDGDNYTYGSTNTATYTLTVAKGTITASATGGNYSYSASGSHAITVSVTKPSSGYTIKYGTTAGNYELSSNPSYSIIGSHTTYYKVSAPNYNDFTGQATVTINKASGSLSFASSSLTKTYGDDNFVNALNKTGDGAVTYTSTKQAVATVDASTGLVTIKGTGTTTIKATMSATDAYSGDYATFSLTVNAASLTGATVTLSQTSYDYDGTAKEPTVSAVILNGKVLTSSDYDVSYSNNTNAGTATVTVTGKGNYTGTATATFNIVSKAATGEKNKTISQSGMTAILTAAGMSGGAIAFKDLAGTALPTGTGDDADKLMAAAGQTVVVEVTLPTGFEFVSDACKILTVTGVGDLTLTQVGTSNVWTAEFTMPTADITVSFKEEEPIQGKTVTFDVPESAMLTGGTMRADADNPSPILVGENVSFIIIPNTTTVDVGDGGYALTSLTLSDGTTTYTPTYTIVDAEVNTPVTLPTEKAVKVTFKVPATAADGFTFTPTFTKTFERIAFDVGRKTYYESKGMKLRSENADLKFYTVTGVSGSTVTVTEITSKTIPANMPFIVENNSNETAFDVYIAETGDANTAYATACAVTAATQFKGSTTATTLPFTSGISYYGFNGTDFILLTNDGTAIPANRCWLEMSGGAATRVTIDWGDGTTAIRSLNADEEDGDWYDINGRKLQRKPTKKGVYIINGQKKVVK